MKTKEKLQFIKRLSFLIRAHIPLEASLTTLLEQAKSKSSKKIFEIVLDRVKSGQGLSAALSEAHKSFRGSLWSIVRVGEESGTLSASLTQLLIILEKGIAARSKVLQALLYPVVIGCGTFLLIGFLILYIFPKITPIFSSLKVPLPLATKVLIFTSTFLRTNFLWILLFGVFFVATIFTIIRFSERVHFEGSRIILKIPFLGFLIQSYFLARISMLLGILLGSHMKVNEAIELVSNSLHFPAYKKFLTDAVQVVSRGSTLSEICAKNPHLFPALFTNMIAVGEMSGSFSEVLGDLASIYESELEGSVKTFTQMIEPCLMVFMSVVVGFVAISIITPLYNITSNLQH